MEAHTHPYEKDKYLNKGRVINMYLVAPRGMEEDRDGCVGTGGRLRGRQGQVAERRSRHSISILESEREPASQKAVGRAPGRGICLGQKSLMGWWIPDLPSFKIHVSGASQSRIWSPRLHPTLPLPNPDYWSCFYLNTVALSYSLSFPSPAPCFSTLFL